MQTAGCDAQAWTHHLCTLARLAGHVQDSFLGFIKLIIHWGHRSAQVAACPLTWLRTTVSRGPCLPLASLGSDHLYISSCPKALEPRPPPCPMPLRLLLGQWAPSGSQEEVRAVVWACGKSREGREGRLSE